MKDFSYRHVIWDWNGTLLNDVELTLWALNTLLARHERPPVTLDFYRSRFSFPAINFYRQLGFDFEQVPFEALSSEFHRNYWEGLCDYRLHDGALELLQELRCRGVSHSLLSAYPHEALLQAVEQFGLTPLFSHIVGCPSNGGSSKVEHGRLHLKQLPYKKNEVVLVGDTDHDVEVAQALGVACILVSAGYQTHERLRECGVPVFASLHAVSALVKRAAETV